MLLTKILANRLASFINAYSHKDQVGFIPGRQGPDQVYCAVDLISNLQKAFNSVSWPYLFGLLEAWGFLTDFITLLWALYVNPVAKVRLQGFHSEPGVLDRGAPFLPHICYRDQDSGNCNKVESKHT